jgi:hypothetical protein
MRKLLANLLADEVTSPAPLPLEMTADVAE